jgi:hypothetical protein
MRLGLIVGLCTLIVSAFVPKASASSDETNTCPITTVPATPFVPPIPYRPTAAPDSFWFGTNGLWTSLGVQGVWHSPPRRDDGYFNKLFLWQEGYDVQKEPKPEIVVILRRLDSDAPLVVSRGGTNAHFGGTWAMLTGVTFPTEGCWEITTYHAGHLLTFVGSVQP